MRQGVFLQVAITCSLALAAPLVSAAAARAGESATAAPDLAFIAGVMERVQSDYVHRVTSDELTTGALKGMLGRLDPHSDYMDEKEYRQFMAEMGGRFSGLGIQISEGSGALQVVTSVDDTPAADAGIEAGDTIVAIDGLATAEMDIPKAVALLRGDIGTRVTLVIGRQKLRAPFSVTLTRRMINVATVKSKLEPGGVGYVRISQFGGDTRDALKRAIETLQQRAGGHLRGFVLDLRGDPGGLLAAAAATAGDFLDGGTVVTIRGRRAQDCQTFTAPAHGNLIAGTPMVVLINSGSASASEIVAGALQDRHRATVIGTQSFGKGSVQTIVPLGNQGALRLTTALYYTPSGRSIQAVGISPDVVVGAAPSEQVANAPIQRESALDGAFASTAAAPARPSAAFSPPIKPNLIGTGGDSQLNAALAYLARHAGEVAGRK